MNHNELAKQLGDKITSLSKDVDASYWIIRCKDEKTVQDVCEVLESNNVSFDYSPHDLNWIFINRNEIQ